MKLRFYMRGLGIGIVVTALIMGIASPNTNNSDADTAENGKNAVMLADIQNSAAPETTAVPETTVVPETTAVPEKTREPQTTPSHSTAPSQAATEKPQVPTESPKPQAPTQSPKTTLVPVPATTASPSPSIKSNVNNDNSTVKFTVASGWGSDSVSRHLEEAGLVKSAAEYDKFLCANGYDKKIGSGTYDIPVGASEEEIAELITGGNR